MLASISLGLLIFNFSLQANTSSIQFHKDFGENPGNLEMYYYAPKTPRPGAPLVVLLHGCKQKAAHFSNKTGWTAIAEKNNLYLLLPQQKKSNNYWRCFNWFQPSDNTRGRGEAASIASMVYKMKRTFPINSQQIFIAGLSSGGSMTNVMMANYPELFRAGAVVAGVPYGCASNGVQAWNCMLALPRLINRVPNYGDIARQAANHYQGAYPKVIVIHGTNDQIVKLKNAHLSVEQWTQVHQTDPLVDEEKVVDGQKLQLFKKEHQTVAALLTIQDQKHGYPVAPQKDCGQAGPFILDSGICASQHIADFWEIFK